MTITAIPSQITYAGDGVSLTFAIPFVFDTSADLKVIKTSSAGVPSTLSTGFSIAGGGGSTGSCTLSVALAVGEKLTLLDDPPLTQDADYTANDSFPAETHERALDRTERQVKRLKQRIDRSIRVDDGDLIDGAQNVLPISSTRSGKYLAFDANGAPTVASGTGNDTALRADLANAIAGTEGSRLVGMRRTFTGAVARTASSIFTQQYWIEDVGATRGVDSGTAAANTPKIQALINAINASSTRCGVINVPTGTWPINDTLTIPAGCVVSWEFEVGAILYAIGFTADKPMMNYAGTAISVISGVRMRNVWLQSDNNLARGITASYLIHYDLEVYFYALKNGWVGSVSYSGKFTNCNGDLITGDMLRLGDDCNHITFDTCRFLGVNGVLFTGFAHALTFLTCSVEGIIAGGAGLGFAPSTGKIIHGIDIIGLYSENVRTYSIAFEGADADSVRNVMLSAPYLTGGFALHFGSVPGNASHAVYLTNITGFEIIAPYFEDWELDAFQVLGTVTDGSIRRSKRASVPALFSATPGKSVEIENNFSGRRIEFATAPPGAGTYEVGDITWNTTPTAGKPIGWTCLTAGSPGTWMPFGATYLEGSVAFDPPSLADGVGTTTTVTVTGAALGDFAQASFSLDLQGISLTAYVSAANTVSVRFQNESGGVLDLASGTLRARTSRA